MLLQSPMMKLAKFLRLQSIVIGLRAADKWAAIDELLATLDAQGLVTDAAQVREDLIAREKRMSTGMELGLAIPHAKSTGATGLAVALGIKPKGLDFASLDGEPARVIFLVVSRKDTTGPHIQCLAEIATAYSREGTRQALLAAGTPAEALRVLTGS